MPVWAEVRDTVSSLLPLKTYPVIVRLRLLLPMVEEPMIPVANITPKTRGVTAIASTTASIFVFILLRQQLRTRSLTARPWRNPLFLRNSPFGDRKCRPSLLAMRWVRLTSSACAAQDACVMIPRFTRDYDSIQPICANILGWNMRGQNHS